MTIAAGPEMVLPELPRNLNPKLLQSKCVLVEGARGANDRRGHVGHAQCGGVPYMKVRFQDFGVKLRDTRQSSQ